MAYLKNKEYALTTHFCFLRHFYENENLGKEKCNFMDFRQLQYITTVAQYRNITKAADALFISQSALSHYIQKAEKELGIQLFDRSTTPLTLTLAGEHYIETARRILLENDQLMKVFRDITHHMTGTLRIGTSRERASHMIPRLLPQFSERYPGIEVTILTDSGYKLTEALREGRIDLVFLPVYGKESFSGIEMQPLYQEELVLVARKGYVLDNQRLPGHPSSVDLRTFKNTPFFLLHPQHRIRYATNELFKASHIRPPVKMEFSSNVTSFQMATTGMGVAIMPYQIICLTKSKEPVEFFSLGAEPVTWDVQVWTRKGAYLGQPERDLIEMTREKFKNEFLPRPALTDPTEK